MKFTTAITRQPGSSLVKGITTASLGIPDIHTALEQHAAYVKALKSCGLEVIELAANEDFPDATFVEDVAICKGNFALITRPGAASREAEIELIRAPLAEHFDEIQGIEFPGNLEGGDVMMVGNHFFIGLSERTNREGANQFIQLLEMNGLSGTIVEFKDILHLKTGVSYLEGNTMVICKDFADLPIFQGYEMIVVPEDEAYAANCIWVNGSIFLPAGFPKTRDQLIAKGFKLIELEMSEFQKVDGGLSCLSLRF